MSDFEAFPARQPLFDFFEKRLFVFPSLLPKSYA
jgi:hypothetical protein